ncbi:MBL fold metallo-hydrolase [Rhizobium sp. XQZ8]|uniref:MBL fold metallo-hydrolase n=1 Tax=Rhizobium populisoli TaxID=2859785 RepID=UPI001C671FC5|nr:MBL fold metallo-hydrolase [Rhizobium populisoli]MBW6425202.1 MBL fold metallo-hydrolase [Rhizobium populisoli]
MAQQIPLSEDDRADEVDRDDGTRNIAADLAYIRTIMANVVFYGLPDGGDRGWVLIDAGVIGGKASIKKAAAERFGDASRPAAIILTHGHFDHVGALEDLAEEWDVQVYAHELEHPYLNGKASYPDGDPTVGGGLMARLSGLLPTKPVDVSARLRPLPGGGSLPFMDGWHWVHTPGHSPGHVSLWRERDRALIVGDAFVTTRAESAYATAFQTLQLHGPPRYFTIDWVKSKESVEVLADLEPDLVISGHGRAMQGAELAVKLHTLVRDFDRIAVPEQGRYVSHPATVEDGSAYITLS